MPVSRLLARILVISMILLPLVACSSATRTKMSARKLCESAGGTYSGTTCNPGSSRNAEAICQAHGGIYLAGEDNCDIPVSR